MGNNPIMWRNIENKVIQGEKFNMKESRQHETSGCG